MTPRPMITIPAAKFRVWLKPNRMIRKPVYVDVTAAEVSVYRSRPNVLRIEQIREEK